MQTRQRECERKRESSSEITCSPLVKTQSLLNSIFAIISAETDIAKLLGEIVTIHANKYAKFAPSARVNLALFIIGLFLVLDFVEARDLGQDLSSSVQLDFRFHSPSGIAVTRRHTPFRRRLTRIYNPPAYI